MGIASKSKNILENIGKKFDPTFPVVAVACANAVFKPLTSLSDKKEKPETKKYAALREFLTEVIAVPTYISCGWIASKGAKLFKDPGQANTAKANLKFFGVCTAALIVIPAVCSVVIKPMTDMIFHKNKKKDVSHIDVTSAAPEIPAPKVPLENSQSYGRNIYNMNTFINKGGLRV